MTKEKKTKSKESKIVDVVSTQDVPDTMVDSGGGTINLQALQALGVDMKITKADLLEYITNQVEEQLTKEREEIQAKVEAAVEANKLRFEEKTKELKSSIKKNPAYAAILDARELLLKAMKDANILIKSSDNDDNEIVLLRFCSKFQTQCYHHNDIRFSYGNLYENNSPSEDIMLDCLIASTKIDSIVLYTKEEYIALKTEAKELDKQMRDVSNKLHNISYHAKSAKMAMLRSILGDSKEGKTLLGFLDSRSRNLKALNA